MGMGPGFSDRKEGSTEYSVFRKKHPLLFFVSLLEKVTNLNENFRQNLANEMLILTT